MLKTCLVSICVKCTLGCIGKVRLASMRIVCSAHSFLSVEEFNPGPIFHCNSLSIQDLQQRKTEHCRRSVERIAGHLRGKQML